MLWIILTVLSFLLVVYFATSKYNKSIVSFIFFILLWVFLSISLVLVIMGKSTYPLLRAKCDKLVTMQAKVCFLKEHSMVPKYARQYIAYIDEAAEYNRSLLDAQTKKRIPFYRWVAHYAFISDKIFTLPLIDLSDTLGGERHEPAQH